MGSIGGMSLPDKLTHLIILNRIMALILPRYEAAGKILKTITPILQIIFLNKRQQIIFCLCLNHLYGSANTNSLATELGVQCQATN